MYFFLLDYQLSWFHQKGQYFIVCVHSCIISFTVTPVHIETVHITASVDVRKLLVLKLLFIVDSMK